MIRKLFIFLLVVFGWDHLPAQPAIQKNYTLDFYQNKLDSLSLLNHSQIYPGEDKLALAANIALLHYPELKGHKIKIKYKKNVKHPITASWAWGNIFKFRKSHTYILLLSTKSFVPKVSLNKQVGILGHEMAHFAFYKKQPSVTMLWWGLRYIISTKYRLRFEREADFATVDHGLGWQLKEIPFYSTPEELENHMYKTGIYK